MAQDLVYTMTSTYTPFFLSSMPQNLSNLMDNKCVFNEEFKFFLLPLSYTVVFLFGLPLNVVAMWIFAKKMRPWTSTTVYMFNLAMSDTLYVLSLPTLIYYYADRNNWPFGDALCRIVRFLFYTNLYSSILFLTCISVHRYLGVCHPLRSLQRVKVKHARMACAGVWLAVTLCLVPNLIYVTISHKFNNTVCHDTTVPEDFDNYVEYSTGIMSLLFGIPFIIITICYGLMARELNKPLIGGSQPNIPSYKRRSIRTIISVLFVFIICFLPFHVTRTLYYYARVLEADCQFLNVVNITYKITRPLASANSCIDPILYFLVNDSYQRRLVRAVSRAPGIHRRHVVGGCAVPPSQLAGGSMAVISTYEVQSIGGLTRDNKRKRKKDCREVQKGDGERENEHREGGNDMMNQDGEKQEKVEVHRNEEGDVGMREIIGGCGENGTEGNTSERETVNRNKSKRLEKGDEKKRKKRGRWSLSRQRNTGEISDDTMLGGSPCEAEGSSTWNLLENVTDSKRHKWVRTLREEYNGKEHRLQSLPKI